MDFSRVDVMDYLVSLGIRNVSQATENEILFSCPYEGHAHGDERPSAYMNMDTTAWMCHGCKRKGNSVSFLAEVEQITPMLALRFIRERYDSDFREPEGGSMVRELESIFAERVHLPETGPIEPSNLGRYLVQWEDAIEQGYPWATYIHDRGFDAETLGRWYIGYDNFSNRITIPIWSGVEDEPELVGFKGRTWDPNNPVKYLVLGDGPDGGPYGFPRMQVSKWVFGLHLVQPNEPVILCEGELNVIALWQMGYQACAVLGSNLSQQQVSQIRSKASEITIFFDSDSAGNSGAIYAIKQLEPYMQVKVVPDHENDPASMTVEQVNNCLQSAASSLAIGLSASYDDAN